MAHQFYALTGKIFDCLDRIVLVKNGPAPLVILSNFFKYFWQAIGRVLFRTGRLAIHMSTCPKKTRSVDLDTPLQFTFGLIRIDAIFVTCADVIHGF